MKELQPEAPERSDELIQDLAANQRSSTVLLRGSAAQIIGGINVLTDLTQLRQQSCELEEKLRCIEEQEIASRELSTPVMEVWDNVLVLPIVGIVDTNRSRAIMDMLLKHIVEHNARCVIIDVTGVAVVDTKTADYLVKVVQAARMLGSRCVLTGLSPAIAQTLVEIGVDLSELRTLRNLKEGLKDCLRYLRTESRG